MFIYTKPGIGINRDSLFSFRDLEGFGFMSR